MIGLGVPICLVIIALELVFELLVLAYLVLPAFWPLMLIGPVSFDCEPFQLTFVSIHLLHSIRLPHSVGLVVFAIDILTVFSWVCVVDLVLVIMEIGFGWGVVGVVVEWFGAVRM